MSKHGVIHFSCESLIQVGFYHLRVNVVADELFTLMWLTKLQINNDKPRRILQVWILHPDSFDFAYFLHRSAVKFRY
jgi:hypothetical protein